MNTALECVPCLVRQTLESAQLVSDDAAFHETIVRKTLKLLADLPYAQSPPEIAADVHAEIRRLIGNDDPYKRQKDQFNALALTYRDALRREILAAADPLERAVHVAIAGNVIDFGISAHVSENDLHGAIEQIAAQPLSGDYDALRRRLTDARRILYLADNTGEIVFDRLLIEQLGPDRVTVVVRGGPIINDATMDDAVVAGLPDIVRVISSGFAAPGTVVERSSVELRTELDTADVIIAKGQGNFESLEDRRDLPLAFLFRVKCPVVQRLSGYPMGSHVVLPRF